MKPHEYICPHCNRGKVKVRCDGDAHHHWEEVDCECVEYENGHRSSDLGCTKCHDGYLPPPPCKECHDTGEVLVDCEHCLGAGYLDDEDD